MPLAMPKASQREPARKPRRWSNGLRSVYSGMKRRAADDRPDVGQRADHQHPGPHIDVDAEFEAAHPAREQHLRHEREQRAGDADQEHFAGGELRQPARRCGRRAWL